MNLSFLLSVSLMAAGALPLAAQSTPTTQPPRPNIILILADDLGYSDLGCYGSEIDTPNLDRLAAGGLRFTQFYNAARCCPTRASLLTGQYPHAVGIGHMTADLGLPGYQSRLSDRCITIAEALRQTGYHTLMSGKWHLGGAKGRRPLDRGFEHYFGILSGACNYFRPEPHRMLMLEDEPYTPTDPRFYTTDAFTDRAVTFIDDYGRRKEPFFLYLAYTAPHSPLHAWPGDIARYRGKYRVGWDELRRRRYGRMIELGLIDPRWPLSPRDVGAPAWDDVHDKDLEDLKMSVFAAQIDRMDRGIGRIVDKIRELGIERNTLIMFLSDNGGCSENLDEGKPGAPIGTIDSSIGYGLPWANLGNTPFRRFKRMTHEGGIATPLIAYWPAAIKQPGAITTQVGHVIDLLPTCLDVAGTPGPQTFKGRDLLPSPGLSLLPVFQGRQRQGHDLLCWEHEGHRAVRGGRWKLVSHFPDSWELYDMEADRTELNNLAGKMPEKVKELLEKYEAWATRNGVVPWEKVPAQNKIRGRQNVPGKR
ncbi:MAG TPA: arylsulfatase [Phycisphaerae bacterium]|nr:arylsulfatase [Phycisphaerae bacterium]